MSHTSIRNEPKEEKCNCEEKFEIPFWDVSCSIQNGKIKTDLYTKDTDKNQYLLPSSCHPKQTTKAILFSLALRIVRVCSSPKDRDKRLMELRERLIARNYNPVMVDSALEKARKVPRGRALKKVEIKKKTLTLTTPYDPRLPAISSIVAKHWRTMTGQDSHLREVFPEPPLRAYKRQTNLRGHLVRAKVTQTKRSSRIVKGMKKCGHDCTSCAYIKEGKK